MTDSWNTALFTRLKTGPIKNIYFYGNDIKNPPPSHVVIRREADGQMLRLLFFIHGPLGSIDSIERYALKELPELLKEPLDINGGKKHIHEYHPIAYMPDLAISDDNTISVRRDFRIDYLY